MSPVTESIGIRRRALVALVLGLLGLGLWEGRRYFIRSWFEPGAVRPPKVRQDAAYMPRRGPVHPVRVVLIDGLAEVVARQLTGLESICRAGLRLRVDVGFPSVSLPVQHVLWTGAWQNQSGILFVEQQLERPVFESLPEEVTRRSIDAVAVAQSHRWIVDSFPWSRVIAPAKGQPPLTPLAFGQQALLAVQSGAGLVLVHILSTDRAGHRYGTAHPLYRAAADDADELVRQIASLRQPRWSLLVLSDHGHLPLAPSGHGGTEPPVRIVQACLMGLEIPPGRHGEATMPDLTRILADLLGVDPPRRCQGRSLEQVFAGVAGPSQPGSWQASGMLLPGLLACGGLIWLLVVSLRPWGMAQMALLGPWGLALSLLLLLAGWGPPSLSRGYIYPMFSMRLLVAAVPAALIPGLQLRSLRRRGLSVIRGIQTLLAWFLLPPVGALALTGWPLIRPPLVPHLSAWTSTLMVLSSVSLTALALWTLIERSAPTADP